MNPRLRAVLDLMQPSAREEVGLHSYDGTVQDLSVDGVRSGLAQVGAQAAAGIDRHDLAHLEAFEDGLRVQLGDLQMHRRNPLLHLDNLDLAVYEREYAPEAERAAARRRHLALWPEAIDIAIATLDEVPAPVAASLVDAVRGLAAGLPKQLPEAEAALAAHARLVEHIEAAAISGPADVALGADALSRLMGSWDAVTVDLAALTDRADSERRRLDDLLVSSCERFAPGQPAGRVVAELLDDHPAIDGVLDEARELTTEVIDFTRTRRLVPYLDGECVVGLAPESRRWATAMLAWAGPEEPDAPTHYDITPPDDAWPQSRQKEWLTLFNRTSMAAITVHEVSPGHFAHSRSLRRAPSEIRRCLIGSAFAEGWAHYAEEMVLEEGFRDGDPRYAAAVALEALCRVTRLSCAIGLHTGDMDVDEATRRFREDAYMPEASARAEAQRGTFDPRYGMYTWGKLEILDLRTRARETWGSAFSLDRFHGAVLALGSPPLGLLGTALDAA